MAREGCDDGEITCPIGWDLRELFTFAATCSTCTAFRKQEDEKWGFLMDHSAMGDTCHHSCTQIARALLEHGLVTREGIWHKLRIWEECHGKNKLGLVLYEAMSTSHHLKILSLIA